MIRNILAVIFGFIFSFFLVFEIESIGHIFYPPPEGFDLGKPETIPVYVKNVSLGTLISVLTAQCCGSFCGGFVTGLISKAKTIPALVFGFLALIMALLNIFIIPHPIWFVILAVLLPIPLSILGNKLSIRVKQTII